MPQHPRRCKYDKETHCDSMLCATCDCFHGGCKCLEGWSGPFCSSRVKVPTPPPTPAPSPWHERRAPAGEMQCDYDVDCLLAPGSRCVDGGCKCPPGTHGKFCALHTVMTAAGVVVALIFFAKRRVARWPFDSFARTNPDGNPEFFRWR